MLLSCSKRRATIPKGWRLRPGHHTETTGIENMEFYSSIYLSPILCVVCLTVAFGIWPELSTGTERSGGATVFFSIRRWFLQRCWRTLCHCWTRWATISSSGFIKRSREAARTNGPLTFLKNSLNTRLSVRLMFQIHFPLQLYRYSNFTI